MIDFSFRSSLTVIFYEKINFTNKQIKRMTLLKRRKNVNK